MFVGNNSLYLSKSCKIKVEAAVYPKLTFMTIYTSINSFNYNISKPAKLSQPYLHFRVIIFAASILISLKLIIYYGYFSFPPCVYFQENGVLRLE